MGKFADLQLLDRDVTSSSISVTQIAYANVLRTLVGGATTYDATGPDWKTTPAKVKEIENAASLAGRGHMACGCT